MSLLFKVPPPVALIGSIGAAVWLTHHVPVLQLVCAHAPWLAGAAAFSALGLSGWGWSEFRRYRTTILPLREPTALLSTGPFRYSRNPLYLAMLVLAATPWLAWGQLGLLLAPLGFFAFVNWIIIPFEEVKLRGVFGAVYSDYCRRVRRWF